MMNIRTHLKWCSSCQVENKIYFVNTTFNAVFYLDVTDWTIHFVHKFSFERAGATGLSEVPGLYFENAIYFFPSNTNVIMKYDLAKQQEKIIPIQGYTGELFQTVAAIKRNQMIYIFPACLQDGIYVLDLQKEKVEKDKEISLLFSSDCSYCGGVVLTCDEHVLLGVYRSNRILEIDLAAKKIIYTKTLGKNVSIYSLYFDGSHYWILQNRSTDICEWDKENDVLDIYTNENVIWGEAAGLPYSNMVFLENEILVLNARLKNVLRINKEKKTIERPVEFPKEFQLDKYKFCNGSVMCQYAVHEAKVLLYPWRGNMLLIYDGVTGRMTAKEFIVSEREIPYLVDVLSEIFAADNGLQTEQDILQTLENFMAMVEHDRNGKRISTRKEAGRLIYQQTSCC